MVEKGGCKWYNEYIGAVDLTEDEMSRFETVKKYIDEYDYYGLLAGHAPDDEFDSYSKKFADEITENDTVEDIAAMIANTMDKAFGKKINPNKFLDTASKIKNALSFSARKNRNF